MLRARLGPLSAELAEAAHAAAVAQVWAPLGFARASDFVRETWGRSPRWFSDLAALGEAMGRSPALRAAVAGNDGARPLGRVAALELARNVVAANADDTAQVESEWIALARTVTVRELRKHLREIRNRDGSRCELENAEEAAAVAVAVRLGAPRNVAAAFEDTLDLHRAVNGYTASTESFLEALAAEAVAGPRPPDASCEPLQRRTTRAPIEEAFDRLRAGRAGADVFEPASSDPSVLDSADASHTHGADPPDRGAAESLDAFGSTESRANPSIGALLDVPTPDVGSIESSADVFQGQTESERRAWAAAQRLAGLVGAEEEVEKRIGRLLYEMNQRGVWKALGFASLGHYAVEVLGMARRTAESRAGILRAGRAVPAVLASYETGAFGLEAAWLVRRILTSVTLPIDREVQDRWIEHAQAATIKRLRHELRRIHLRAIEDPFNDSVPWPATDAEWFESLRREPGMTRERLRTLETAAMDCDTPSRDLDSSADVFLRFRVAPEIATSFLAAVESARRHAATSASEIAPTTGAPASVRAARMFLDRERQPPAWVGLLALLEDYAETHDDPRAFPKRQWDAIYSRDGWQCMAPGCTSRCRMDDHHIVYRADRGSNEPANQITLCRFHHQRGEHGRYARVRGTAPLGLVWRLGTRALATYYQNERRRALGLRHTAPGLGGGR